MQSLKKSFFTAVVFLGSFSSYFANAEEQSSAYSLEYRLQQLANETEETTRLQRLFALYWDWRMAENPDEATYFGYPGLDDQWPDLSPEAVKRRADLTTQFLQTLESIPHKHLIGEDQISYDIFKYILEDEIQETRFQNHYFLINQMFGMHLNTAHLFELIPYRTLQDYENALARLARLPLLFQQVTQRLQKGLEAGITPPRIAIRQVPQQIANQMTEDPFASPYLQGFTHFPDSMDASLQADLREKALHVYQESVLPALDQLYNFVKDTYLPNCRKTTAFNALPNGPEWYAHKVKSYTTTNLTPEEIHALGLKEVARIQQAMFDIMDEAHFEGNFEEFLHFLKTDPQFFFSTREDLLHSYQTLTRHIETKLPLLFAKLPKLPFEVVPIPAYSEESQIAAYYCQGSVAYQRPGYFFINTSYPEQRSKWEMEPLALHEAVPGHHLQISIAQELQDMPEFRKNAPFTAYIEGWGLYAEGLGKEIGLYRDPYSKFGRLTYEMLRAIRLVVDTGMHAMDWSRDQAIDFFKQYVSMSDHEIVTEVDRYLVMPGQALAYKIGELKTLEMRAWATQMLGNRFDVRAFHDVWLKHGTLTLDIAEQQVRQWVEETLNSK